MGVFLILVNSNIEELVLTSTNWIGDSIPYSYTITNDSITSTNIIDLIFNPNTEELKDVLLDTEISGYSQEEGSITIYAWGNKPNIDIPITIIIRGGI